MFLRNLTESSDFCHGMGIPQYGLVPLLRFHRAHMRIAYSSAGILRCALFVLVAGFLRQHLQTYGSSCSAASLASCSLESHG